MDTSSLSESSTEELSVDIDNALEEVMAGLKSLEMQQQWEQRMTLPAVKLKQTPKHTPDLVLDLPERSTTPPSRRTSDPDSPVTAAETFATCDQSTLKKAVGPVMVAPPRPPTSMSTSDPGPRPLTSRPMTPRSAAGGRGRGSLSSSSSTSSPLAVTAGTSQSTSPSADLSSMSRSTGVNSMSQSAVFSSMSQPAGISSGSKSTDFSSMSQSAGFRDLTQPPGYSGMSQSPGHSTVTQPVGLSSTPPSSYSGMSPSPGSSSTYISLCRPRWHASITRQWQHNSICRNCWLLTAFRVREKCWATPACEQCWCPWSTPVDGP